MSQYAQQPAPEYGYESYAVPAAEAPALERVAFIKRTYAHLALAIVAFVGLTAAVLSLPGISPVMERWFLHSRIGWFVIIALYYLGTWGAQSIANRTLSRPVQYACLGAFIGLETLLFLPVLWAASTFARFEGVIPQAGLMTLCVAGGLMVGVLFTKQDFSFLGPILSVACFVAMGLILAAVLFGFSLGLLFCFAMVAVACASILYQTSQVLHHYDTRQHVPASIALFASVMFLFWYILQIFMSRD